ncbi:hypothetical protein [Tenacibaculum sp. L6]|uniref:hypothetical protein n=1 Tax=Tenacibaculum sp. L6 TaxID=2992764 RepID=UPI00237AF738|nr:hypothetical protein [Tenacibaculum sp. L6]MDE0535731.1 hypothetical protein [Tenacibaculum sp. L6]
MKKTLTTFLLLVTIYSFGQGEVSIEITKANYKSKESKLTLDISFKNNTDSLIYIISPKNYFFDKHLDRNNELNSNGLYAYPFKLEITSNKKCKIDNEPYEQVMANERPSRLFSKLVELKPNESKLFENIEINRFDGDFCSKREYKISVVYKPYINPFEEEFIEDLKTQYELVTKQTKELNGVLYYSLGEYRSTENDNFIKLKDFLYKVPKMKTLNDKTFKSNTITATETE